MLQAAGLEEGYCPELFNVERPEVVKNIHAQYLQHGSDVITTNTFGACGLKLDDYDLQDRVREINIAAVKVAKDAIAEFKPSARVAGSMGPTGRFLRPLGNMSFDDIYDTYREQADALIEAVLISLSLKLLSTYKKCVPHYWHLLTLVKQQGRQRKMYKSSVSFLSVKMDVLLQVHRQQ